MSKVRVAAFGISADRYGAGPEQDLDHPLGRGGELMHRWFFPTRTFRRMVSGEDGGSTGVDDDFAARSFEHVGAWIIVATRSVLSEVFGQTTNGRGGGDRGRPSIRPCSC